MHVCIHALCIMFAYVLKHVNALVSVFHIYVRVYSDWFFSGLTCEIRPINNAEACKFIAGNCKAQIAVVEDQKQLDKFLKVRKLSDYLQCVCVCTCVCTCVCVCVYVGRGGLVVDHQPKGARLNFLQPRSEAPSQSQEESLVPVYTYILAHDMTSGGHDHTLA